MTPLHPEGVSFLVTSCGSVPLPLGVTTDPQARWSVARMVASALVTCVRTQTSFDQVSLKFRPNPSSLSLWTTADLGAPAAHSGESDCSCGLPSPTRALFI